MKLSREQELRDAAERFGQEQLFRFWSALDAGAREELLKSLEQIDFALMDGLVNTWVRTTPATETFEHIVPIPIIPLGASESDREACEAGEQALRDGRVAVFVVAGGQGTRLGFDGPKGRYPIGPITGKCLFRYHAEKIHHAQRRYGAVVPWYIMVSSANGQATRDYFHAQNNFGLDPGNIVFVMQRMVPAVDPLGKIILEQPQQPAMSPNGHGGCIQALVEGGALQHAEERGVEFLSYFQVDNWAAHIADPRFIGHHVLRDAAMSSKCHRRNDAREAVGVHCLCDGAYRVIEYSELDLYPQLLETDANGAPVFFAGNPAIHMLSVPFVRSLYAHFDAFPWHRAYKKVPYADAEGRSVKPDAPNGYKFETFVFDALRFVPHPPVALEIARPGEYTPIKDFDGTNSVIAARASMAEYWAPWLEAAGCAVPRDPAGTVSVPLEISPAFAGSQEEFTEKMRGHRLTADRGLAVTASGDCLHPK